MFQPRLDPALCVCLVRARAPEQECGDWLGAVRRATFHAVVGHLIGGDVAAAYGQHELASAAAGAAGATASMDDFMAFQVIRALYPAIAAVEFTCGV